MSPLLPSVGQWAKEDDDYLRYALNRFVVTGWEGEGPNSLLMYRSDDLENLKVLEEDDRFVGEH